MALGPSRRHVHGREVTPALHRLPKPPKLVVMNSETGKVEASLPIGAGVDATGFNEGRTFANCRDGSLTMPARKQLALKSNRR